MGERRSLGKKRGETVGCVEQISMTIRLNERGGHCISRFCRREDSGLKEAIRKPQTSGKKVSRMGLTRMLSVFSLLFWESQRRELRDMHAGGEPGTAGGEVQGVTQLVKGKSEFEALVGVGWCETRYGFGGRD